MEESEGRGFSEDRSEIAQAAPPLVRCSWCERLHPGEHPLSVCPACTARFSTMRLLEMSGPHPLNDEAIDEAMSRTSPGNYALGYMDGDTFLVFYVGRSDFDVALRLHRWVDLPSSSARYVPSARAAWGSRRGRLLPLDAPAVGRIGACADTCYTHFAYSYARSAEAALEKEYRNFDDFGGCNALDNESQPVSAAGPL